MFEPMVLYTLYVVSATVPVSKRVSAQAFVYLAHGQSRCLMHLLKGFTLW